MIEQIKQALEDVLPKRFIDKVDFSGECWLWTASKFKKDGYGSYSHDGKNIAAHRLTWICINGDIPKGKIICHKCDTPSCVNPTHLFVGTHKENMEDMFMKSRGKRASGERNKFSKLTTLEVEEIRKIRKETGMTHKNIGKQFNVTRFQVMNIVNYKSRKEG